MPGEAPGLRIEDFGLRIWDLGLWIWDLGLWIVNLGHCVENAGRFRLRKQIRINAREQLQTIAFVVVSGLTHRSPVFVSRLFCDS